MEHSRQGEEHLEKAMSREEVDLQEPKEGQSE